MVLNITIPDTVKNRVIDALCANYGYQAELTNEDGTTIPNPQTKAQFAKAQVINFLKENCRAFEANQAANTARQTAITTAETDIQLS